MAHYLFSNFRRVNGIHLVQLGMLKSPSLLQTTLSHCIPEKNKKIRVFVSSNSVVFSEMFVAKSCRKLLLQIRTTQRLYVLQKATLSLTAESKHPPPPPPPTTDSSLFVGFLIDSCGLSPEKALSAAKKITHNTFRTEDERPKSVITFLETTGFSKTHISKIISSSPSLLFSDVEKTLKPRIKLFEDGGLSGPKLAELIASKPRIMARSFRSQIIPALEFVRSFVQTDENVIKTIQRAMYLLSSNPRARMEPNINLLKDLKVSDSRIAHILINHPGLLMIKTEVLKGIVETLEKSFGFKPESRMFTIAVHVMCSVSKSTWDSKIELLKSLGWSEEQIFDSFRRWPYILACSEKKLKQGMDLYATKLNWDACVISKNPKFILYSLEARVIPRLMVSEILMSKKIMVKEDKKLIRMLNMSEESFLQKYVIKYQNELPPHLLQRYKNGSSIE